MPTAFDLLAGRRAATDRPTATLIAWGGAAERLTQAVGPHVAVTHRIPPELLSARDVVELFAAAAEWVPHIVQSGPRKGQSVVQNPATGELRDRPPGVASAAPKPPTAPNAVQRAAAKVVAHPVGKAAMDAGRAVGAAASRGGRVVGGLLATAARVGESLLDHMPGGKAIKAMGSVAVKVFHAVEKPMMAAMYASQELCRQACWERGYPDEYVDTLGKVLWVADMVGGYAVAAPAHVAVDAVAGPLAGLAAANVAGFMPTASVAYLIQSTARNPLATWRAAKRMVRAKAANVAATAGKVAAGAGKAAKAAYDGFEKASEAVGYGGTDRPDLYAAGCQPTVLEVLGGRHRRDRLELFSARERLELFGAAARPDQSALVGKMADSLHRAPDKDWWQATVLAALAETGDHGRAVEIADELAHERPDDADGE